MKSCTIRLFVEGISNAPERGEIVQFVDDEEAMLGVVEGFDLMR